MMQRLLLTLAAMAMLAGPALSQTNTVNNMKNAVSKHELDATMGAQNNSKQDGSVVVKDVGGGIKVMVTLKNEPAGAVEPSHIHLGTCAKLNPAPWKPLHDVVGGHATTVVKGVSIAQLKRGHYAVNVHKSAAELTKYVSCGDL